MSNDKVDATFYDPTVTELTICGEEWSEGGNCMFSVWGNRHICVRLPKHIATDPRHECSCGMIVI